MKPLLFAALCLVPVLSQAQETTASGALHSEASWNALQNRINTTNGNVAILRTDVDAILKCGKDKKIWNGTKCEASSITPTLRTFRVIGGGGFSASDKLKSNIGKWSSCYVSSYADSTNVMVHQCSATPKSASYKTKNATNAERIQGYSTYKYYDHTDDMEWEMAASGWNCEVTCINYSTSK